MHSFNIAALVVLVASAVTAAPALVELEPRLYPTVANISVQLTQVDPAYLELMKTIVVNLDENAESKRDLESRQSGTCNLQGFAIVNGQQTPFQGSVQNTAANFGRAVGLTGILPGCTIGLIPQANCALWSITDTSGCATSRSVTFSN